MYLPRDDVIIYWVVGEWIVACREKEKNGGARIAVVGRKRQLRQMCVFVATNGNQ